MHLHWVITFIVLTTVYGQSKSDDPFSTESVQNIFLGGLSSTPLPLRGLWCTAKWSQASSTYTQTGQAFFYNNGTFTFNYLDNPSATWVLTSLTILIITIILLL